MRLESPPWSNVRDVRGFALKLGSRRQQLPKTIMVSQGTTRRKLQNTIGEKHGRKD
jgi:hypothetical protein